MISFTKTAFEPRSENDLNKIKMLALPYAFRVRKATFRTPKVTLVGEVRHQQLTGIILAAFRALLQDGKV